MNPSFSSPISFLAPVVVASLSLMGGDSQAAVTSLIGDHAVVPESGEAGNLSVTGSLSTDGDLLVKAGIDFGYSPAISSIASGISYFDVSRSVAFDITRADATFLWRDNVTSTADSKMSLDGNNLLTLFKSDGATTGIVLNPNTGAVTLAGSASGIYSSAGNPLLQFGSGGAVFSSAVTFQDGATFGSGGKLDASNVGYLRGVLGNLGYKESGGTGTAIKQIALSENIHTVSLASGNGYLYVTGNFNGSASVGGIGISSQAYGTFVAKCSTAGQVQWLKWFDSPSFYSGSLSVAANDSGECVIGGLMAESLSGSDGSQVLATGMIDGYAIKFASDGTKMWHKRVGGNGANHGRSVAIDSGGNVFLGGWLGGNTTTLGGGGSEMSSAGAYDGYVVKFNSSNGATAWSRPIGGWGYDSTDGIAVDPAGNVYVTGTFVDQTRNLGVGVEVVSDGGADVYLVKIAGSSGNILWSEKIGGPQDSWGRLVTVSPTTWNPVVTGMFSGSISNLGSPHNLTALTDTDLFVVEMNASNGDIQWSRMIASNSIYGEDFKSIRVNSSGKTQLLGHFTGTISFLTAPAISANGGPNDTFLITLGSGGAVESAQRFGSGLNDIPSSMTQVGTDLFIAGRSDEVFPIGNTRTISKAFAFGWDGSQVSTPASLPASSLSWSGGTATGSGSVALGGQALAGGSGSAAVGLGTTTGNQAFSAGSGSAFGDGSAAFGNGTWAGGAASAAFGQESRAGGNGSAAFGIGTRADAWASLALGSYNKGGGNPSSAVGTDPLLEVGNGTSTTATGNALTTLKNGKTILKNKHWLSSTPLAEPGGSDTSGGAALVVEGHTLLEGKVTLAQPQGDISMGIYGGP